MPLESISESDGVYQPIITDRMSTCHLRMNIESLIHREQCVIDHVAVVSRDIRSRPDRVRVLEIGVWHDLENRTCLSCTDRQYGCREQT